jgi:DNA-directed RNA polymerase
MRFKESAEQGSYLRAASDAGRLEGVFRGLDVLSSTPWRINRDVFEVVLTCWNRGEAIADMPASEENSEYPIVEKPDPDDPDPAVRSMYVAKMRDLQAQIKKDHSERCKFNYNLELARSFLNDVFYIPHNLDFRGRAYPVPPHLNPVGDDLCRGLLTFGEKKPLGERGLMWLRIHLANLYGFDKASFKEREQFAIDHEADILDSVDRPLDGNRWWAKAEDPWQCLATCYELAGAIRSGKPFEYLSSLPVHQDGTCNGMQHYAALGGDVQGAKAVNLVGGDRPADVYTRIADLVNEIVNQDAEAGKVYAQIAQCKITRKVVKQTVMTTVYGVTFIGAKEQIAKQLLARGEINREYIYHVSGYIASTVLSCIGDLFSGAKAIQDWLTLSARMICKSFPLERAPDSVRPLTAKYTGNDDGVVLDKSGKVVTRVQKEAMTSVIWTTPLGLPVVQPYRKTTRKQVATALQSVYISDPNAVSEVASGKQASAMPPNFIHSLDATHMLMCAARCRDDGVTFASVHDSYWSHASSIDQLSSNIRETFIELHSRDIIGDLRKEVS